MRIRSSTAILLVASLSPSVSGFAPSVSTKGGRSVTQPENARQSEFRQKTQLYSDISTEILDYSNERQVGSVRRKRRRSLESSSASSASPFAEFSQTKSVSGRLGLSWSTIQPVLSAALLVTGNTVGASALVLPEVAARPGMAVSSGLFVGAYLMNLISGLVIAEVAIKQHETSGNDVPSSFKEFADGTLDLPNAGTIISIISLFVNACVMSFDLTRAGQIASNLLGGGADSTMMSVAVAGLLTFLVSTQSSKKLSNIASMAVTALFVSFGSLLVPGLAGVHDPVGAFFAPGTAPDIASGVSHAAPIILMTMVYQNIVPSVTKILDYDRTKSVAAIALGSFIPLCMYLAWAFATIGGGIDPSIVGGGNPLLTAFSVAAVTGSTIGATMSLSEEVETFFVSNDYNKPAPSKKQDLSLPAVATSVGLPLTAALLLSGGEDFTAALSVAGGYGSPLLYGAIPAAMAWTQRKRLASTNQQHLVPGGLASLGGLGGAAVCFMGQEFIQDVGNAISSVC